ncbi:hypothetical protein KAR91_18710 [Candidatus Pacearchaeota archaeon]|nr:hypothetical protein [Candidatus Pacearchaeota archaeon]
MEKISEILKGKRFTAGFAFFGLMWGFMFMEGSFSGNVVLAREVAFNPVSLIGALLMICSVVLIIYSVRRK